MINQAQFEKGLNFEAKRLTKWLNKTESPLDACESLIFYLINNLDASYYEIIGLLEEAKLRYREITQQVMKEEAESEETFN